MQNADVLDAEHTAATPSSPPNRWTRWLGKYWDFLAVLLLIVATVPPTMLSSKTLHIVWRPGLFDDSWTLETDFKASRGLWYGRDVAFDYGPLFQWLSSAPGRWMGPSMGAFYDTYNTLPLWFGFLLSYFALRLLLPEQRPWKRFLLLLLLSVYWSPFDVRSPFAIFLFAVNLRGWYAVRQGQLRPWLLGIGAAFLCSFAFLNNADTGIYGIVALLLSLGGVVVEDWQETKLWPRYLAGLLSFAVALAGFAVVINCFLATAFDFRFWKAVLAFIRGYRWNAAAGMSSADGIYLLAPLVVAIAVFFVRWFVKGDRKAVIASRPSFLLSALGFACVALQSGLVRSDSNHIGYAIFPLLFLTGVVLFSFRGHITSVGAALVATGATMMLATPIIGPSVIKYRYRQVLHPIMNCPAGYQEIDRACYPINAAATARVVSNYLQDHSAVNDWIVVFPYQYLYGLTSRRNVAQGVEQAFLAHDAYLKQLNVNGLEREPAPVGLYFPDAKPGDMSNPNLSLAIDEVPNLTRNPEIWFWMFHHYRTAQELLPGVFGLQRDDSRKSSITMDVQALGLEAKTYPIAERNTAIDLGAPSWPLSPVDFIRLRLKVSYSAMWKLRKPERMQLEISRADGSRELKSFVMAPNTSTDVWFYPWSEAELGNYFDADEARWRPSHRPAITEIRLLLTPLDWVSQTPQVVTLESADAVRFTMGDDVKLSDGR
jgi:hypothetical protein